MKKFDYTFREGLPGGPNEVKGRVKGSVTKTGYKRNSPDVHNDFNVIPSPYITMVGVDFPVYGEDNLGNGQMMYPGENYEFPGDYVTEMPAYGSGGLTQWFAEEWVDVKTGEKCGRSGKDKNGRPYPACRPSKRVNKTTPKTTKEMSSAEKAKFKKSKTSSKRINYNHERAQEGIEVGNRFLPPAIRNMQPKEDPIYYDGIVGETTVTAPRYEGPQIRRLLPGEGDPVNSSQSFIGADKSGGIAALKAIAKGAKGLVGLKGSADDLLRTGKIGQFADDIASTFKYKSGTGNPYQNLNVTDDLFQGVPHRGAGFLEDSTPYIEEIKTLGRELDEIGFDANWVGPEHLRYRGNTSGRSIVEVALPGKSKQTQLFYKSTGYGNKAGAGVNGTTQDLWQAYPGHMDLLADLKPGQHLGQAKVYAPNWFMKGRGAEDVYNVKSFKGVADRLDDLTKEAGFDLSGQIGKYQEGGENDPEMMFRDEYNTLLKPAEERRFNRWVTKESKRQGRDILMDMGAYDVRGFWKSGDHKRMDQDNHGSDAWKKPNHPTFSNQSRYHGTNGWYGGNWTEDAGYQPSKQTLQLYTPDYYKWMFGTEPNRPEHLDMSRYESGINTPTPMYYQQGGSLPKAQTGKSTGWNRNFNGNVMALTAGQKGFDDWDEYQYRNTMYNDSLMSAQVSNKAIYNLSQALDPSIRNIKTVTDPSLLPGKGTTVVSWGKGIDNLVSDPDVPYNSYKKGDIVPMKGTFASDVMETPSLIHKISDIDIVEKNRIPLSVNNYLPINKDNAPISSVTISPPPYLLSNYDYYVGPGVSQGTRGNYRAQDNNTYDYMYYPKANMEFGNDITVYQYQRPNVQPVFTGTKPSPTKPIAPLPTKPTFQPEPVVENTPVKEKITKTVKATPVPTMDIYSRRLNQQTGEYIYDTSEGNFRKKIGPEDAAFVKENMLAVDNLKKARVNKKAGGELPKAQDGKKIAEVANQMVLNGEDGTRPPLNLIDNMVALFDKDGVCRDNTCVNVVKDIYKRAGYDVIPEGVYNNRAFKDDYDSYGLQLVAPQNKGRYILDDLQPGDIIQYRHDTNSGGPLGKEGYPFHLGVYDENGQYISDGSKDDPIKKQSVFYYDDGTSKPPFDVFRLKELGGSVPKAQEGGPAGTYSVKPGDTFYGIANRTGIDARTLQFNNPGIDINKIKPGQVLNVPGLMGPNPVSTQDVVEDKKEEKVKPPKDAYEFNDLLYRQAYQESRFDPTAVSPKGYKGFTQLGKGLMQDYAGATGDKRNDPFDPDYAIAVQKWAMDKYLNNTGWIKGSDKVKQAKALAAYNWGPGNTLRFLNSQKEKGVDIYSDDLPWLESLPGETKGYINNILNIQPSTGWEDAFRKDTTDSKYSKYYRQSGGETLYDYVKGLGYSPTFKNRKQIFGDYFQEEYKGTAKQNIELLNKLKAGDLNIDQYAEKADVQRVAEPVIQQPAQQPAKQSMQQSMQQPVQQLQTPLPVQETPTQKSSYRGSTSLSTDEDLNRVRQGLVKRANDIISGKADPYRLPSNVANIVKQQKHNGRDKNPGNYTCIGGVCTLLKSEGVIDEVITSNTEFARVANNSGFSKRSFKLENLKEGDIIQHMGAQNKSGNTYPTHAQMYLGRDEDGNYMFFDNWEITSDKSTTDGSKDGLKKYSPGKMKTFIEKGEQNRLNGAYFLHLNKEDAYDPEEQTKRARAQKNKARRLPGELYIDENFDGREYYQEVQSSQDVPYIYRGKKDGSGFENDLVGLFNNSEMDERMKSTFGITEQTLNDIKPMVYGIISQESNMNRGARFEGAEGLLDKTRKSGRQVKYKLENIIAPTGVGDLSYGPGSVRWSGLRRNAKKQIGKRKNITTPEGSYFAIVDLLLQSANSGERYVGEDLNPDLLDKNPWYPALYAYNGQMSGNRKGKTWGLKKGYTFEGSSYSADPGSYPMKVQGYADQLKRFVPIDYEPTIDNYYDPRYVPVVKPKGK